MPFEFDFTTLVRAGDPRLAPQEDIALAYRTLRDYEPDDEAQAEFRRRMLAFISDHPHDAHKRELLVGHLTASALVVDADCERALLTHHKKLNRWLQLGGHCDGDANLAGAALREALEESGIADLAVLPRVLDLDIHAIPARGAEPEHLHLDTRFLVLAPRGAVASVSDESHALAWVAPSDLPRLEVDASVRRLFRIVFGA